MNVVAAALILLSVPPIGLAQRISGEATAISRLQREGESRE
ncbi:hypothetical protein [Acrocarpospora pleiomorpha]|nr:hypothetical protein [Acrocarpospora pleiomorpha]